MRERRPASLQLRLQGEPTLILPDGRIRALEPRAAALLALVAIEGEVSRDRAAALLWSDSASSRGALRQQLARFRRSLGHALAQGAEALALADDVLHDLDDGCGLLGDLAFEDCPAFADWLMRERRARRAVLIESLRARRTAAEAAGDSEALLRAAEALVAADPDDETHYRALMRLHAERGDMARAQAVYAQLVDVLRQRHAAVPSPETEALARALRSAAANQVGRAVPVTLLRPPRMVGRARELAALAAAWADGRSVLVLGEAGLGKSRLLAEFAQQRHVVYAQGRPGDADVPYATLVRLLRAVLERCSFTLPPPRRSELARLLPELAPDEAPQHAGQSLLLQAAVEALLAGAQVNGNALEGVIVDDLHFADAASVEMLQAVSGALHAQLRFVFAQRPGEGAAALQSLRDALAEGGLLTTITLAALDTADLAALLAALQIESLDAPALAAALASHTGGNPQFVLETLKQGWASGALQAGTLPQPASVQALLARRLAQLSPRALYLARLAAIAGPDFGVALAEHALGARAVALADAWTELQDAQVLRESSFAHDLVAEAVLRSVPEPVAREQHASVAAWLQQHDGEPARVAQHLLDAGAAAEALPWLRSAGARARLAGRMLEAGRFWQRASDVCDQLGRDDEAFDLLYEATLVMSESVGLTANAALADQLHKRARSQRQRARALMMRADVEYERGAPRAETIAEGLACARAAGDRHTEAQLLFEEGKRLATVGDLQAAREQVRGALALMEDAGGHDYVADKLSSLATLDSMLGDLRAADAAYERSRALSLQHRIYEGQAMRLTSHALLKLELGDAAGARARLDELAALEEAGLVSYGAGTYRRAMLKATVLVRLLLGEPAAALQLYFERIEGSADAQDPGVAVMTAWLFDQIGRRDLSLQALETARRGGPRNMSKVLFDLLTLRDDPAAAAAKWADHARLEGFGDVLSRCLLNGYLAVHAPGDAGLESLQALCDEARSSGWHGYLGGLLAALAQLYARRGERALAVAAAADAETLLESPGMFSRPWGLLRCATAYQLTGQTEAARRCAQTGAQLTRTTALTLPSAYQQSFLDRHPVHRELIEAAQRRRG
jgi:DNA-binding SARP family transcriptional activator